MAKKEFELDTFVSDDAAHNQTPAAQKRRRNAAEKGLPDHNARLALAKTYLDVQHRLWPDMAVRTLLPSITKSAIARFAENFEERFVSDNIAEVSINSAKLPWKSLGVAYLRYSDANSNPRSLDQQLFNILERAHRENIFIPWEYVCADAAVTGTIASRHGYEAAKVLIEHAGDATYLFIDEIGRASRDAIEAMKLGRLVNDLRKRLIGVSDGFDSDSAQAKLTLSIFAALQEWYVDQLRTKVNRGMRDAFRQGRNIQPPCLGYKMVPVLDADGKSVVGPDNDLLHQRVIDEEAARWVRKAFHLYTEQHWSPGKIARLFNKEKVGGVQTWDNGRIRKLLRRHVYVGIQIYRQTYQVRDPETGKVTTVKRPRNEWLVRRSRHLQIVSWPLFKATRQRLEERRRAFSANPPEDAESRATTYPTTLFRPICDYCGSELWFGRSGKYSSFYCKNGPSGLTPCRCSPNWRLVKVVQVRVFGSTYIPVVGQRVNPSN